MLKVNEIFYSIQGESTKAGLPCVFVRLTYCNLRCTYCDTEYAFYEGEDFSVDEIIGKVKSFHCNLVEITGGEPLLQPEVFDLMNRLCDEEFEVMLETGGSLSVEKVDKRVKTILDFKTPSSGMAKKNLFSNIELLKPSDEVKFVIGSREDYEWAKEILLEYKLPEKCSILFSPIFDSLPASEIAEWILHDKLPVRFQLQLHKFIWHPEQKGV